MNKKLKPTKRSSGRHIYHAYSNVNFDLWLILHKQDYNKRVSKNDAYINDVRRVYGLKRADDIKSEDVINKILGQITLKDVKEAIKRAENIRIIKEESDSKNIFNTLIYENPDFSIHEFLRFVLKDSGDLR